MLANLSRRSPGFLGLAAVVALLHAWLLDGPLRPLGGAGTRVVPDVLHLRLVAPPMVEPRAGDVPDPAPHAGPPSPIARARDRPAPQAPVPEAPALQAPVPEAPAPQAPAPQRPLALPLVDHAAIPAEAAPQSRLAEGPWPAGHRRPVPEPAAVEAAAPPVAASPPLDAEAQATSAAAVPPAVPAALAAAGPVAPPSPAVAASAAARWQYQVSRGAASGAGELQWTPEGNGYELRLRAAAPGSPALDWISRGQLGVDGLAPDRMVERQRERETQAVNFQRDKGLISFSGPSRTEPLLPGAQDRLSWILQVAAQARARGDLQPGELLRFQVASPRGDVDEWRFTVQPVVERLLSGQRVVLTHLLREPQRPHDLRVQLWLSRQFDQLPVGLAWAVEPDGIPLEMWLTALPVNY